jgi:hypothetical protein
MVLWEGHGNQSCVVGAAAIVETRNCFRFRFSRGLETCRLLLLANERSPDTAT